MRQVVRLPIALAAAVVLTPFLPVLSQTQQPPPPPNLLVIYREEVKPGKGAAHETNEKAWAGAYTKTQAPITWLGMTSLSGPSEAWFLTALDSYAALEKMENALEGNATFSDDGDRYSAAEGDLLSRTSTIIASLRPALGYGDPVSIPHMRYMQIDVVQIKPGYGPQFVETMQESVAAHTKAQMKEAWAVYSVDSGMPAGTFLVLHPRRSLASLDDAGAMHTAAAYRGAVGESGRARFTQFMRGAVVMQGTRLFALKPAMSLLSKDFIAQDPEFWTPKPAMSPAAGKNPGEKP